MSGIQPGAIEPVFVLAVLLAAAGLWLMLPGSGGVRARMAGAALAAAALGLLASQVRLVAGVVEGSLFYFLSAVTLLAAVATISFRNPVYSAIWFGLTLLGSAGLLLYQGAQFLAAATVVVYAGAILVTFLFVLMLAQPQGRAPYDRVSWDGLLAASTGAVLVGVLSLAVVIALDDPGNLPRAETAFTSQPEAGVRAERHVLALGNELFGRHLIAVEVAGTLLLAALVGAAAIVANRPAAGSRASTAANATFDAGPASTSVNPGLPDNGHAATLNRTP